MDEINQHAKETEHEVDDDMMVEEAYQRLLKSYLSSPHRKKVDIINKAFNFARQAHKGVRRLSGCAQAPSRVLCLRLTCLTGAFLL